MKRIGLPVLVVLGLVALLPLLVAFRSAQGVAPQIEQAVFWIITLLVGWFGPRFLEVLFAALGGISGPLAVVITFAISLVIGALAVYLASHLLGLTLPTDFFGVAFIVLGASQIALNRLKDQGKIAS